MPNRPHQHGFTLIELSIVLVIVGLLIGGIVVGRDLIEIAKIRREITYMQSLSSAVLSFKDKYRGLPGDLANATNFFSYADIENGDGNQFLKAWPGPDCETGDYYECNDAIAGEVRNCFAMLSAAQIIPESYSASSAGSAGVGAAGYNVPISKLGRAGILPYGFAGSNYWHVGLSKTAYYETTDADSFAPAYTPMEAFNIDSKMDDGNPSTGRITAFGAADDTDVSTASNIYDGTTPWLELNANSCASAASQYNTASGTVRDTPKCQLRFRW